MSTVAFWGVISIDMTLSWGLFHKGTILIYAPLGFFEKTKDNLTSTSVKVVPLTVTSMYKKCQQKILQFSCATAQKLTTVRYARMRF